MARYAHLRFDIWICLALAFLAGLGVEALAKSSREQQYETYKAKHVVASGEIVAARINTENVTKVDPEGSYFTGNTILPIGRLVQADLEDHETFLHQIEFKESLSRHDFYVDMVGDGAIESPESYINNFALGLQILTIVAVFAILHFIGSKIGLFPAFFTKKKTEPKSDWE